MKFVLILLFLVLSCVSVKGQTKDEVFVKRAYLNIVGHIPSYDNYTDYIKYKDKEKLVDALLNSDGYVNHWGNFWMDALRVKSRLADINYFSGELYSEYIKQSIKENKPYNQFVQELLSSKGDYLTNPNIGYFYRDLGMPLDNFIGTMKIFGGINVACSQCHDSPSNSPEEYTQLSFYQSAAFFAQNKLDRSGGNNKGRIKVLSEAIQKIDPKIKEATDQIMHAAAVTISVAENKHLNLPHDYQYKNGSPNQSVSPKPLFGEIFVNKPDSREEFVSWLLASDNFSENAVSQMWTYTMGGKVSEVKKKELSKRFRALEFDVKKFLRYLYLSPEFAAESNKGKVPSDTPVYRRLSAAQMWDSIITLTVDNPDYFKPQYAAKYKEFMSWDFFTISPEQVIQKQKDFGGLDKFRYEGAEKWKDYFLIRSIDVLDMGGRNGQLLKELGRTDRNLISPGSTSGSVTQILSLLNGPFTDIPMDKSLKLMKSLDRLPDVERVERAFITILSRRPSFIERDAFLRCKTDDLTWALLNSSEFKFN